MCDGANHSGFQPRAIIDLKGTFKVQKYQRGYKWGPRQILALLKDIYEFDLSKPGRTFYCLQPTVVTELTKEFFELIDGQQRLSTIFIILNALDGEGPHFSIDYETRTGSAVFLKSIKAVPVIDLPLDSLVKLVKEEESKLTEAVREGWKSYINAVPEEKQREVNNIDNFHFYQAWQIVHNWFGKAGVDCDRFRNTLLHHTKVIWYEVDSLTTPEKVFLNLNSGKIGLTGSELIKALFVLQIQREANADIREFRQNELAREWDLIETTLQRDDFWSFLAGDKMDRYMTRIDFVFDLLKGKPENNTDRLWAYYQYDSLDKEKKDLNWEEVNMLFLRLRDWYEDVEVYHRIGFLINSKIAGLERIWNESKTKGKVEFRESLNGMIKTDLIKIKNKIEKRHPESAGRVFFIEKLDYNDDRVEIQKVLLLFNLVSLEKSDPGSRFPFGEYPLRESSLEHIHPQNPKAIKTAGEARDWLSDFLSRAKETEGAEDDSQKSGDAGETESLAKRINGFIKDKLGPLSDQDKLSEALSEEWTTLGTDLANDLDLHGISNLALLGKRINSKIGNKKFLEKREILIEIDQDRYAKDMEGNEEVSYGFIPPGTRNAFLKYYSRNPENIQMSFWSITDAASYQKAIETMLKGFLPAKPNPQTN